MSELSNAFSLLELDVEDAKEHTMITLAIDGDSERVKEQGNGNRKDEHSGDGTSSKNENDGQQSSELSQEEYKLPLVWIDLEMTGNGNRKDEHSGDGTSSKNENDGQQSSELSQEEYKLPLVWIDLEMTGLNVEVDRILEIACIVTDGNLNKSTEGPDLVIHQSKECLDKMGEWCQQHHGASGLTEKVLNSTISEQEAEKQVVEFVKRHVGTYTPLLAGNSVYVDFLFLKKYMPNLAGLFSHILVDVSSVKALCLRWYPRDNKKAPQKENKHRALDDIKESIAELKYYKENIFKPFKSKK